MAARRVEKVYLVLLGYAGSKEDSNACEKRQSAVSDLWRVRGEGHRRECLRCVELYVLRVLHAGRRRYNRRMFCMSRLSATTNYCII